MTNGPVYERPRIAELIVSPKDKAERLLPLLLGRVFHVTYRKYLDGIIERGGILGNADGSLPSTYGAWYQGYHKLKNRVSFFDYATPTSLEIEDTFDRCAPWDQCAPSEGIAILFLDPSHHDKLIPWSESVDLGVYDKMIVPWVEAGYQDRVPWEAIEEVLLVRMEPEPGMEPAD